MSGSRSYRDRDYHGQSSSSSNRQRDNRSGSPAGSPAPNPGAVTVAVPPPITTAPSPRGGGAGPAVIDLTNSPGRRNLTPRPQAHIPPHGQHEEERSPSAGPGPAYPYYLEARSPTPGAGQDNASRSPSAGPAPAYPYHLDARSPSPGAGQVRNTRSPSEAPAPPPPAHLNPGNELVRRQDREVTPVTHLDGLVLQARAQYDRALARGNYQEQLDSMTLLREAREDREAELRRLERVREQRERMDAGEELPPRGTVMDGLNIVVNREGPRIYWHNGRAYLSSFP